MEMVFINKKTFRQIQINAMRDAAAPTDQESGLILDRLLQIPAWQQAQTIATTVSSPIEFPTDSLIKAALNAGKRVYLPKTMPHRKMAFLPYQSDEQLIKSSYGLLEPAYDADLVNQNVDLVIVPGVAFALDSHYRVGFGGGYYDRFLANYQGRTVALVPKVMEFKTAVWPIKDHDIRIDTLITGNQVLN